MPESWVILPYTLLTINSLLTAGLFAFSVVYHLRHRFMLFGAAAMAILAIWFALLAITAGPTPVVERRNAADALRIIAALIGPVWLIWLLLYARSLIVIDHNRDRS